MGPVRERVTTALVPLLLHTQTANQYFLTHAGISMQSTKTTCTNPFREPEGRVSINPRSCEAVLWKMFTDVNPWKSQMCAIRPGNRDAARKPKILWSGQELERQPTAAYMGVTQERSLLIAAYIPMLREKVASAICFWRERLARLWDLKQTHLCYTSENAVHLYRSDQLMRRKPAALRGNLDTQNWPLYINRSQNPTEQCCTIPQRNIARLEATRLREAPARKEQGRAFLCPETGQWRWARRPTAVIRGHRRANEFCALMLYYYHSLPHRHHLSSCYHCYFHYHRDHHQHFFYCYCYYHNQLSLW